jgi:hypothetical protein
VSYILKIGGSSFPSSLIGRQLLSKSEVVKRLPHNYIFEGSETHIVI